MPTIKEQEKELLSSYMSTGNKEKKRELVSSLTPLIRSQVGKYTNSGLPYQALELEGKRLTSEAIESYDPSFDTQLNTHVTNYLRKLSRFTNQYQNVGHIPEPRALMLGKYDVIYSNLEESKGREPTVSELSDSMQVPQAEIERLQKEQRNDLSIEAVGEADETGGFYTYVMPDIEDPMAREAVEFVYFDAEPVDKKILEYMFGLGGTQRITSKEIKAKLNLTESDLRKRRQHLAKEIKSLI
jgi:DNA-directed RNA polymerase sigma subunit (sigma70/sigma32)